VHRRSRHRPDISRQACLRSLYSVSFLMPTGQVPSTFVGRKYPFLDKIFLLHLFKARFPWVQKSGPTGRVPFHPILHSPGRSRPDIHILFVATASFPIHTCDLAQRARPCFLIGLPFFLSADQAMRAVTALPKPFLPPVFSPVHGTLKNGLTSGC
jgi:hypothetical protein